MDAPPDASKSELPTEDPIILWLFHNMSQFFIIVWFQLTIRLYLYLISEIPVFMVRLFETWVNTPVNSWLILLKEAVKKDSSLKPFTEVLIHHYFKI